LWFVFLYCENYEVMGLHPFRLTLWIGYKYADSHHHIRAMSLYLCGTLETQWEIQIEHVYFTMGAIVGQNRYLEMVMGSMTNW
jgi:hypothetical protein